MSANHNNKTRKILLIGWDGADWEHINPLLEAGEMPALEGLINEGVMGNLATLQPVLSPMLWNSVATGKFAIRHGIHGFIEPDPLNGGARPATSYSRKCRALWNMLTLEGMHSNVIGWWASHPAEKINGTIATNSFTGVKFDPEKGWSYPPGTFYPQEHANEMAKFRVFPSELTQEHLLPFIPNAANINQAEDHRLSQFAKVLADTGSIQALGTAMMEMEDWDFTAIYFDCIDHLCHGYMNYYPPRLPFVPEEDYEMYKDVISGAYKFHDMMLARQLELAGPDATVIICSDHGFESKHLRAMAVPREPAGPAASHRDMGIIVMKGPGIKKDERIYGASLIDIAPTILTLYGLPVGEDMDGRPLVEAFETFPEISTIPSWDDLPGECGMHSKEEALSAQDADELMQQFAALGYIDDPDKDKSSLELDAEIEQKYNLGRQYLWLRDSDSAIEQFEYIVRKRPWETRFILYLAECYYASGYLQQLLQLLDKSFDMESVEQPAVLMLVGKARLELDERKAGLALLERVEGLGIAEPGVYAQLGELYLRLRLFDDAERNFLKANTLDEENPVTWQGLSSVYCRRNENEKTIETALNAVGFLHRLPRAHYNLGVALARTGNHRRAITAFETALAFAPRMFNAHRWLARLYRMAPDGGGKFIEHQQAVERVRAKTREAEQKTNKRHQRLFDLPVIPSEKERQDILLRERPNPERPGEKIDRTLLLVSGLPRSGTSLMMQMLEAGGIAPRTDDVRRPDEDNPKGYYEWDALKKIGRHRALLDEEGLDEKAIKAVSVLLQKMPMKYRYKVIFMTRSIDEVVDSQNHMVIRQGVAAPDLEEGELARRLEGHRSEILAWLAESSHMDCLLVDYSELVNNPGAVIPQLQAFLGERVLAPGEMAAVIDPRLYRNRV